MPDNSLLVVPNPTLSLVLVFQMAFTAGLCIFVVLDTKTSTSWTVTDYDDSFEYLSTATWMLSCWNFSWLCPTLLTLFSVSWISMHVALKLVAYTNTAIPFSSSSSYSNDPCASLSTTCWACSWLQLCKLGKVREIQIIICASYICFSVTVAFFFACASADAVCDPLVRLVILSASADNGNHQNNTKNNNSSFLHASTTQTAIQMLPLSEVPLAGNGWIAETSPPPKGGTPCVAYTRYSQDGQSIIVVAVSVCIAAFIVSNAGAWLRPLSFASAKMAVAQCVLVVSILGCSAQVVLNNDSWDWRVVNSLLAAIGVSAYLAACVTTLDAAKRGASNGDEPSVWERAAWIYVQLLLACEEAALRLTDNS